MEGYVRPSSPSYPSLSPNPGRSSSSSPTSSDHSSTSMSIPPFSHLPGFPPRPLSPPTYPTLPHRPSTADSSSTSAAPPNSLASPAPLPLSPQSPTPSHAPAPRQDRSPPGAARQATGAFRLSLSPKATVTRRRVWWAGLGWMIVMRMSESSPSLSVLLAVTELRSKSDAVICGVRRDARALEGDSRVWRSQPPANGGGAAPKGGNGLISL